MAYWDDPNWKPQLPTDKPAGAVAGHWNLPNWHTAFLADPGYQAAQAALTGGTSSAGTVRKNAIQQALIHWGIIPKSFGSIDPAVMAEAADPATLAAAAANPNSILAQLNVGRGQNSASLQAQLGARGGYSSGAFAAGEQGLTNQYEKTLAADTEGLLGDVGGAQGAYGTTIGGLNRDWATAMGDVSGRVQGTYQPTWQEDVPPPAPPVVDPLTNTDPALGAVDPATQAVIDRSAGMATAYSDPAVLAALSRRPPPRRPSAPTRAVIARSKAMAKVPRSAFR